MVDRLKYITVFLVVFCVSVYAQTTQEIDTKNRELKGLKNEIATLEAELVKKKNIEKKSYKVLENINQQGLLLNKLINRLLYEERLKENEINKTRSVIDTVENNMTRMKEDYSRYIVWVYKQGPNSLLKYLTNSRSFNQALTRYKYLGYITEKNEEILGELKEQKDKLIVLNQKYKEELEQKERLVKSKNEEQSVLTRKKNEKQSILKDLKNDRRSIEEEIKNKRMAEIQIKNIIAKLVEAERRRLARLKEAEMKNEKAPAVYNYTYDNFESFEILKGKLGWPVNGGKIVRKFGENRNKKLNTVTLNYGVDIKTNSSREVVAVAEGIVSAIDWIPGYGSIVILTHKNEFRTVYGHLSDISVREGDRIKGGTKMGIVDESLEGNLIHFEIWNNRNYQNPEVWLVRR